MPEIICLIEGGMLTVSIVTFTPKERKLLRLALDPAAQPGEAENAWLSLLKHLRKRAISAYELEKIRPNFKQELSDYFAALGRKSRGTYQAHERAQAAAFARWERVRSERRKNSES